MMKKTFKNIRTLAALLMAGAAFTACSSDDSIVEEQPVVNPSEPVYTLTINATNGDATTRALNLDGTGKLSASWAEGDVVTVTKGATSLGTLSVKAGSITDGGLTATFEGTLSGAVAKDDVLTLTYHPINPANPVGAFEAQDGTLKGTAGAEKFDVATATVTVASVNEGKITATGDASFETKVAMIKLTLQDNAATPNKLNATSLKVSASLMGGAINKDVLTFTIPASTYTDTDGGAGILYFALPSAATVAAKLASDYSLDEATAATALAGATITFTATVGGKTYTVDKTGYKFAAGKYYKATLTMTKQAPAAKAAAEATAEDKGKLIGTDGNIYADVAAATAAGTTAVAKIIYLGTTGHATYTHGLALALTDEASTMAWQAAIDACSAKNTSTPVTDATWLLASKDQWDYMLGASGAGSYTALRDGFGDITGASNLQSKMYWSNTEYDSGNAWRYHFGTGSWGSGPKGIGFRVRACLAF